MDKEYIIKETIEWIICIISAIAIALVIKYFLITPTIVQQTSMYPTLIQDQRLILNRITRITKKVPERGQIVTFEAPSRSKNISNDNITAEYLKQPNGLINKFCYYVLEINKISYIKRVIGLPGEKVELKDGKVYINGNELEEKYLKDGITTSLQNENINSFTVPDGTIFVMGDNRPDSIDSRTFGCIPIEKLEGIVAIRFWPFSKFGTVK